MASFQQTLFQQGFEPLPGPQKYVGQKSLEGIGPFCCLLLGVYVYPKPLIQNRSGVTHDSCRSPGFSDQVYTLEECQTIRDSTP